MSSLPLALIIILRLCLRILIIFSIELHHFYLIFVIYVAVPAMNASFSSVVSSPLLPIEHHIIETNRGGKGETFGVMGIGNRFLSFHFPSFRMMCFVAYLEAVEPSTVFWDKTDKSRSFGISVAGTFGVGLCHREFHFISGVCLLFVACSEERCGASSDE